MRPRTVAIIGVLALFWAGLVLRGLASSGASGGADGPDGPSGSSGQWTPAGTLAQARAGAASVLLDDGRLLVTGGIAATGDGAVGAVSAADVYASSAGFSAAAPMTVARTGHSAVTLEDGRVLVVGGSASAIPTDPALASAEIYDPSAASWTPVGSLADARTVHTASLLADGRVLIAGGANAGVARASLEIFDPATLRFSTANAAAIPRKEHAAATLADGRVLFAGGTNDAGVVASIEMYDPVADTIASAAMSGPRTGASATRLLDGKVLIAGGNDGTQDLVTAEVFDPSTAASTIVGPMATPRRGHQAFLLPNNNSVLMVGGTSTGVPLADAELFVPGAMAFSATGRLTDARLQTSGAPLLDEGRLVVAGGANGAGLLASAERYSFATVKTDWDDYAPGETVTITGEGWEPGETVTLRLHEAVNPPVHDDLVYSAIADSAGRIYDNEFAPDLDDVGVRFYLTATGTRSQALNTFTDGELVTAEVVGAANDVTVAQGATANFTIQINATGPIQCTATAANPATATVRTVFAISSSGALSSSTPSAPMAFFAGAQQGGGQNCDMNWTGAPTPYSVAASVSAAATTPIGTYTIVLSASAGTTTVNTPGGQGSNLADATATNITVHVTAPPDSTPPVITPTVTGTAGANGWYVSDVTVSWSVTDPESTITSQNDCTTSTVTTDTTGVTFTCTATSAGGTNSKSVTVKRDTTPPSAALSVTAGTAGAHGWYTTDVTVQASGTDTISSPVVCTADQEVTTETTGTPVSGSCTNNAGLTTSAVPLTIKLDKTGPSASLAVTGGTAGANGWYTSDVTVHASGSDSVSTPVTCTADQHQTAETAGTPFNGSCTNDAGLTTAAAALTVKLDKTGPTGVASTVIAGTAGAHGWYISDVTVHTTGTEDLSGPVTCTGDQTLTADTAGQGVEASCTNQAGLTTSAATVTIKLDKTAPSAALSVTGGTAGANGWFTSDVTVHASGSDTVSNPVVCTADQQQTAETTGTPFGGSCTNDAGLTANAAPLVVKLDKTAPSAVLSATGAAGENGWFVGNVTVNTNGTDSISSPVVCTGAQLQTTDTTGTTFNGSCTNNAGLTANATPLVVKLDKTPPVITVSAPSNGSNVILNASVASAYGCTDATSGLATCSGPVANGANFSTSSVGPHAFTVTATDNAGNSATLTTNYGVQFALGLCLGEEGHSVLQPINVDGSSVFKQKSTVPVRFRVCDAKGNSIGSGVVSDFRLVQIVAGTAVSTVNEVVDSTTPDTTFRFDPSGQQWIFNSNTKSLSPSMTYGFLITLTDSTTIQYQFGLK